MMETHQYTSGLGSVKNCWSKNSAGKEIIAQQHKNKETWNLPNAVLKYFSP